MLKTSGQFSYTQKGYSTFTTIYIISFWNHFDKAKPVIFIHFLWKHRKRKYLSSIPCFFSLKSNFDPTSRRHKYDMSIYIYPSLTVVQRKNH